MEILHYDFMVRALLAGLTVGSLCPAVGVFLVLRRYSFMAETLAHISLVGVAIGMLSGIFPSLTTLAVTVLAAAGVEKLRVEGKLYGEAVLALVMSSGLALGVVLISLSRGFNVDVMGYLFGSILSVTPSDLLLIMTVALAVMIFIRLFFKEMFFISFDEECAQVAGLPVQQLNFIFAAAIAVTVSIALRIVGALLVGALMVIPVTTALLVASSFRQVFWFSVSLGVVVSLAGLIVSYYLGMASGGTIVLLASAIFGLTLAGKKAWEALGKKNMIWDAGCKTKVRNKI